MAKGASLTFDSSSPDEMDAAKKEEMEQQKINKWMHDKKMAAQKSQQ
jgi:hypothetical protein